MQLNPYAASRSFVISIPYCRIKVIFLEELALGVDNVVAENKGL